MENATALMPLAPPQVVFCDLPEYEKNTSTMLLCGKKFYQVYAAQEQLLPPELSVKN